MGLLLNGTREYVTNYIDVICDKLHRVFNTFFASIFPTFRNPILLSPEGKSGARKTYSQ